jgi:hypothetical protein
MVASLGIMGRTHNELDASWMKLKVKAFDRIVPHGMMAPARMFK